MTDGKLEHQRRNKEARRDPVGVFIRCSYKEYAAWNAKRTADSQLLGLGKLRISQWLRLTANRHAKAQLAELVAAPLGELDVLEKLDEPPAPIPLPATLPVAVPPAAPSNLLSREIYHVRPIHWFVQADPCAPLGPFASQIEAKAATPTMRRKRKNVPEPYAHIWSELGLSIYEEAEHLLFVADSNRMTVAATRVGDSFTREAYIAALESQRITLADSLQALENFYGL